MSTPERRDYHLITQGQDQEYGLVSVFKKITRLVGRLVPVFFRGNLQGDLSREIDYTPPVADPRKHAPRRRETSYWTDFIMQEIWFSD